MLLFPFLILLCYLFYLRYEISVLAGLLGFVFDSQSQFFLKLKELRLKFDIPFLDFTIVRPKHSLLLSHLLNVLSELVVVLNDFSQVFLQFSVLIY